MADIQELHRRIEQLEAENEQLNSLVGDIHVRAVQGALDHIDAAVLILDTDYRVLGLNKRHADEAAFALGRMLNIGDNALEALAHMREQQQQAEKDWQRVFAGEKFSRTSHVQPQGDPNKPRQTYEITFSPLRDDDNVIYGGCAVTRNVTEIRDTQEALLLQNARLDTAIRNSGIMLFQQNTELIYEWYYSHNRHHFDDLIGQTDEAWLSVPEDVRKLTDIKQGVLTNGERVRTTVQVQRKSEDFPRTYDLTLDPLHDDEGNIVGLTGAAIDRTETVKMERELVEAKLRETELEQKQKVIALREEFLAMMSHDFREPLAAIMTSQSLLQRYMGQLDGEKRAQHLHRIQQQVYVMDAMIDDVMLHYTFEAGKQVLRHKMFTVNAFLLQLFKEFEENYRNNKHDFVFRDETDGQVQVHWDDVLMRRVVYNLLANAYKYSPEGGRIVLALGYDVMGDVVHISVQDDGMGIPQDELPRLFEPFRRARNSLTVEGTGLGLSIVQRIVSMHGGEVGCDSVLNRGTTFTVQLPAALVSSTSNRA